MSDENKDAARGGVTTEEIDNRIAKAVESLKAKHGNADVALFKLVDENYGYRDQLRDLKAKVPAEGAVVLTGDDAAEWGKFRGLGKYSDVNKRLGDGKAASDRLADIESTDSLKALGSAAGMNPTVFARLAKQDGVQLEKKPGKDRDGKPAEQVFVKGEGDSLTPIDEYAAAHWSDFLPSLKGEATPPQKPRGTPPAYGPNPPAPRPGKGDDIMADLPYEHAPPAM